VKAVLAYLSWLSGCLLSALIAVQHAQAGSVLPAVTDRLIVKYAEPAAGGEQPDTELLDRLMAHAGMRLDPLRIMSNDARVLVLPQPVSIGVATAIAERLAADPDVEYALADRLMRPFFVPNDALYAGQWNLFEDAGGIRLPAAWDVERGAPGIVIALVDTGILPHGDLDPARVAPGYDFIGDVEIANDGDGRDADPSDPGDWVAAGECGANQTAEPSSWHGTSVTGVIGALTDNSEGIAGVNHGSRLMMARALGKCGGYTSDLIDAMRWAAGLQVPGVPANANPARVINLSFGGEGPCSPLEQDAIDEITARGAVVIAAAGNEDGDVAAYSPGNCSNVVTVAATTRSGARAWYTNSGSGVDVSAPGGDFTDPILSTGNSGTTTSAEDAFVDVVGTSFATAHVSGVAGLVLSANGDLNSRQVREILVLSARPFPDASCNPLICGSGIVDANAAVQLAMDVQGQPDSDGDGVNDIADLCPATPAGEAVDVEGCSASQLDKDSGGGGGGGGCVVSNTTAFDPLLILMVLVSVLGLKARGIRSGHKPGSPALRD
jgi:serine protease